MFYQFDTGHRWPKVEPRLLGSTLLGSPTTGTQAMAGINWIDCRRRGNPLEAAGKRCKNNGT